MKKIKDCKKLLFITLPIIAFIILADLLSKFFVNKYMEVGAEQSFIPGFINFINVHNNGAAWNIFSGNQIFLIVFTIIFLGVFGFLYYKEIKQGALFHVASAFIFGGSIGNLIDRIAFGYVRDMIHLEFWPTFPVFNIADSFVCVGVVLIIIFYIIYAVKTHKKKEKTDGKI